MIRIYKDRYYLMRDHPGLSGFRQWDKWEYWVTTGRKAQHDRLDVVEEYKPTEHHIFRLEDGHVPDCQPRVTVQEALAWLDENPFQRITRVQGRIQC